MITESWPWRRELKRVAEKITRVTHFRHLRQDTLHNLEKDILIGFFSVRKLIDAKSKIEKRVAEMELCLERCSAVRPMGSYQRFDFYEYFDLKSPYLVNKDLSYVSNQMVHSLLFNFGYLKGNGGLGVFFVSDKDRLKFCNFIAVESIAKVFTDVAVSNASSFSISEIDGGGKAMLAQE